MAVKPDELLRIDQEEAQDGQHPMQDLTNVQLDLVDVTEEDVAPQPAQGDMMEEMVDTTSSTVRLGQ